MKVLSKIGDLTSEELLRLQNTLRSRYLSDSNIVEIGFGLAEKRHKVDRKRTDSVCFYVRKKRKRVSAGNELPRQLDVRLKRGKEYVIVRLPTDVIEIGSGRLSATGRSVCHSSRRAFRATSGSVIAWRVEGNEEAFWGLVTVGHIFRMVSPIPESSNGVLVEFTSGRFIAGRLLGRSFANDGSRVDAALILVSKEDLVDFRLLPANATTGGRRVREWSTLKLDTGRSGVSRPRSQSFPLQVLRIIPESRSVPDLGVLDKVLEVGARGGRQGVFAVGTSGSLWMVQGEAAAIQHGGLKPGFSRGWGQSLELVLQWSRNQLAAIQNVNPSKIDLRLVHTF